MRFMHKKENDEFALIVNCDPKQLLCELITREEEIANDSHRKECCGFVVDLALTLTLHWILWSSDHISHEFFIRNRFCAILKLIYHHN